MQFLLFLYHNQPDFISLSTTPEFISGLVATLFPYTNVNTESKVTTPQEEYVVRICAFIDVVCLMMFNATFNNISVISWRSVLLVENTGVSGENHQPVASR
jgi:hypothetical protein